MVIQSKNYVWGGMMANTAVIFKSKYGATGKYAEYIAQTLKADIFNLAKVKKIDLAKYDTVIYGGGIYAGSVNGVKFISSHAGELKGKNLAVFTIGIGDPKSEANVKQISKGLSKAIPAEIMKNTHIFSFRGGMDYSKLSFAHRMMMSMVRSMVAKKPDNEKTADDRHIIETYGKAIDYTDFSTTAPLIEYADSIK